MESEGNLMSGYWSDCVANVSPPQSEWWRTRRCAGHPSGVVVRWFDCCMIGHGLRVNAV